MSLRAIQATMIIVLILAVCGACSSTPSDLRLDQREIEEAETVAREAFKGMGGPEDQWLSAATVKDYVAYGSIEWEVANIRFSDGSTLIVVSSKTQSESMSLRTQLAHNIGRKVQIMTRKSAEVTGHAVKVATGIYALE
ncbi:MAG: hypothetical protein M5U25_20825 [Planctomycetota bacterium]|nr:hypothetical protein [Planctomycetota bacterium]MCZ7608437.1 hypothetical protein [Planctomycetota bacterium]